MDSPNTLRFFQTNRKTTATPPKVAPAVGDNAKPLSTHTYVQWPHDLMIDHRLFNLSLGDTVEIRAVADQQTPSFPDSEDSESEVPSFATSIPGLQGAQSAAATASEPNDSKPPLHASCIVQVTTLEAPLGRVQVSLNRWMATAAGLGQFSLVTVHKLSDKELAENCASHVVLSLRGGYASRGELWLLKKQIVNRPLFLGKVSSLGAIEFRVEELRQGLSGRMRCAIVGPDTEIVFRSACAQIFWFIQLSKEMWDFADDGDLLHERLLDDLLPDILNKWNADRSKHALTVVFFTRTVFNGIPDPSVVPPELIVRDLENPNTRCFVDFYHVVVDKTTRMDWPSLLSTLQQEFSQFPARAKWAVDTGRGVCGLPSTAMEGNLVHAINLVAEQSLGQYIDRELPLTGTSITIFTPGPGVFELEAKLSKITEFNVNRLGLPFVSVISLTVPPLHRAPLLVVLTKQDTAMTDLSLDPTAQAEPCKMVKNLVVPKWLQMSFPYAAEHFELAQAKAERSVARMHGVSASLRIPLPESRMYAIPDPSRASISSALLSSLERARVGRATTAGLGPFSTWANVRRIPQRHDLSAWYPGVRLEGVKRGAGAIGGKRRLGGDHSGVMSPSLVALHAYSGVDAQHKAATPSWILLQHSHSQQQQQHQQQQQQQHQQLPPIPGQSSLRQISSPVPSASVMYPPPDSNEVRDRQRRYDARTFTHGGGSKLGSASLPPSGGEDAVSFSKSPSMTRVTSRAQSTSNLAMLAMTPSRAGIIQAQVGRGELTPPSTLPAPTPIKTVNLLEMIMPEIVPLTTDSAPSDRELYTDYQWKTYSFEMMSDIANCLNELICLRLAFNFQIYKGDNDQTVVLICGPVVHALSMSAQRIDVTIWERLAEGSDHLASSVWIWNNVTSRLEVSSHDLGAPGAVSIAWNHLDTVICEDDEVSRDFMDTLSFAMIFSSKEEAHLAKFFAALRKKWPSPNKRVDVDPEHCGIREAEWIYVRYDAIIVPDKAFCVSIYWVAASTKALDWFCADLMKLAQSFGARLIQVPSSPIHRSFAQCKVRALPDDFIRWKPGHYLSRDGAMFAYEDKGGFLVKANVLFDGKDEDVLERCRDVLMLGD